MWSLIKGFLPSKYMIGLVIALAAACVFFYQRNEINVEKVRTAQTLLNEANKKIESQKGVIDTMRRDHSVEVNLLKKSASAIDVVRQKTIEDLQKISNTDFGKEANSNAPELEKRINDRTKQLMKDIEKISRGTK